MDDGKDSQSRVEFAWSDFIVNPQCPYPLLRLSLNGFVIPFHDVNSPMLWKKHNAGAVRISFSLASFSHFLHVHGSIFIAQ
ncbi:hypothetical protein LDG_8415 [Legionella drancourtii LLAP12]|uniref:Uncharacterized protein n=1 Tax=Legionella drancourtii LLAP12 TaxID=658187 RepID=G9ESY6_9GAMM|nr:hypothetical protein LDG_8415 [Legionella drancourtii LLAP12]